MESIKISDLGAILAKLLGKENADGLITVIEGENPSLNLDSFANEFERSVTPKLLANKNLLAPVRGAAKEEREELSILNNGFKVEDFKDTNGKTLKGTDLDKALAAKIRERDGVSISDANKQIQEAKAQAAAELAQFKAESKKAQAEIHSKYSNIYKEQKFINAIKKTGKELIWSDEKDIKEVMLPLLEIYASKKGTLKYNQNPEAPDFSFTDANGIELYKAGNEKLGIDHIAADFLTENASRFVKASGGSNSGGSNPLPPILPSNGVRISTIADRNAP